MSNIKWSILVLTQATRGSFLYRLMAGLFPQVASNPGVEVVVTGCDYSLSLGENRECMRKNAVGEYICFVDDDDLVSADYVQEILPRLTTGVDYVGFRLQMYVDGQPSIPTFNSLSYRNWYQNGTGYYRDISHVCPIRRELALQVSMEGSFGEDRRWAERLRKLGILKTEEVIDKTLYHYYYRTNKADDVRAKR